MTARSVLKWTPVGFALQMLIIILFDLFVGLGNLSKTGYGPWISLGEFALPAGPSGLAMSLGAMFGLLFGMLIYSLVVGTVLCLLREPDYK